MALSRCILPYDLRRSCLPNRVLKDICCGRTIKRELESSGRFILPCHVSLSFCLDVLWIKSLWTDAIVGWDINALLRLCVGVCEAAVGVVAPVVTWLSSLGGGFSGHSVLLPLVLRWAWLWCHPIGARGHTVVCPGGLGIRCCMSPYGSRAAVFRLCVLIECSDCLRLAVG